jgi:hypothetical protein
MNHWILIGSMLFALPLRAQVTEGSAPVQEVVNDCTLATGRHYVAEDIVKVAGDCDADLRPHGHWVFNYRTGRKGVEGDYQHGRKTGVWTTWNKDGVLFSETSYNDSTTNYIVRTYWHDGRSPKSETTFNADGSWLIQTDWDVHGRRSSYPNVR